VAIRILRDDFAMKKTFFVGGQMFHVHCCTHITILLVQDEISQTRDIVDCGRDGIMYLLASQGEVEVVW
jgi:hypothetical protein